MGDFIIRLILGEGTRSFSDKIKKCQLKTFQDSFVKPKVSKNGKQQEIQIQSNVLASWYTFLHLQNQQSILKKQGVFRHHQLAYH